EHHRRRRPRPAHRRLHQPRHGPSTRRGGRHASGKETEPMNTADERNENPREQFARMRRNLIDRQTGRLAEAAGQPTDEAIRWAFADVAAECTPDTIDTLAGLLRRLRAVAPDRVGAFPVVAFAGYGQAPGMRPNRGV